MPARHIFVAHCNPVAATLDEFEQQWPLHVQEMVDHVEGFVAAQRFRIAAKQAPWALPAITDRMVIYEVEADDAGAVHRSHEKARDSGRFTPFEHLVEPGHTAHLYSPVGTPARAEGWGGLADAAGLLFVRSNPSPGFEEEYERWYDIHLVEVIAAIDGYVGAERFRIHPSQLPGTPASPWQYVNVYERDATDLDDVYASHAIAKANRDTVFTPQNGVLADDITGHSYSAVGPRIVPSA